MMMSRMSFFILMALVLSNYAIAIINTNEEDEFSSSLLDGEESSSLRGMRHFGGQYINPLRATMTCDKFPRICRGKGSPGPDCCKKQCVNVMNDNLNCGLCGRRCRFGESCCGGECVNVMYDAKNCGGCKNRCKKGSFCKYGMCSYA